MQQYLATEEELLNFAVQLAQALPKSLVIYLKGQLGAGKTTLTRGMLRALGFQGKVKSPTYTLVEQYEVNGKTIFHFDLYRLKSANELEEIGIYEYFTPQSICLIEWPENGSPLLPKADLTCFFDFSSTGRTIDLTANTDAGKLVVEKLKQSPVNNMD